MENLKRIDDLTYEDLRNITKGEKEAIIKYELIANNIKFISKPAQFDSKTNPDLLFDISKHTNKYYGLSLFDTKLCTQNINVLKEIVRTINKYKNELSVLEWSGFDYSISISNPLPDERYDSWSNIENHKGIRIDNYNEHKYEIENYYKAKAQYDKDLEEYNEFIKTRRETENKLNLRIADAENYQKRLNNLVTNFINNYLSIIKDETLAIETMSKVEHLKQSEKQYILDKYKDEL